MWSVFLSFDQKYWIWGNGPRDIRGINLWIEISQSCMYMDETQQNDCYSFCRRTKISNV